MKITLYRLTKSIGAQQRRIGEIIAGKRAITFSATGMKIIRDIIRGGSALPHWRPTEISAARRTAILFYFIMKHGTNDVEPGAAYHETQYRKRVLSNLKKRAKRLGYERTANATPATMGAEVS